MKTSTAEGLVYESLLSIRNTTVLIKLIEKVEKKELVGLTEIEKKWKDICGISKKEINKKEVS